jgi:hypothetical protein
MVYSNSTFVRHPDQIGCGEVFAILTPVSTTIPGDERSKTNPGHGYPEHMVQSWDIEVFDSEEDWKADIIRRTGLTFGSPFKAVRMTSPTITTKIEVEVKI